MRTGGLYERSIVVNGGLPIAGASAPAQSTHPPAQPGAKRELKTPRTVLLCPLCGKPTGTRLRLGDASGYCRFCRTHISIVIEIEGNQQSEDSTLGA